MLCVLWAVAARGGQPQCPTSGLLPCLRSIGDGRFGAEYHPGKAMGYGFTGNRFVTDGVPADAMCSKSNYVQHNRCGSAPSLRLTIVEPAEFQTTLPLFTSVPVPWEESGHIDQTHPAHGKVLDLVGPEGGLTSDPCDWRTWNKDGVSGQIVVARPARCPMMWPLYYAKYITDWMELAPPAAYIYAFGSGEDLFPFGFGSASWGFETIPLQMGPGTVAYIMEEARLAGKQVRGKIELVCQYPNASDAAPGGFTDGCPDDRLRGLCDDMPAPEDRLCSKCPLQVKYGEEKVCAYGTRMFPSRGEHFFQATRTLPSREEVVYVVPPPWGGCRAEDFAGVRGKVAAFPYRYCMRDKSGVLNAARLAEKQGATGVIWLSHIPSWFMLSGAGFLHSIPIHVVSAEEAYVFVGWFESNGGANSSLTVDLVDEDTARDPVLPVPPTPAPIRAVTAADTASFEATPGVVVSVVLIVLVAGAIGGKLVMGGSPAGSPAGADADESVPGVPLSVASMLLSVSLLLVVTVIACSLSASAARQATDTASSDGQTATGMTYAQAKDNAARMSGQILSLALRQVVERVDRNLRATEQMQWGLQELFDIWDGSWQGFKEIASAFYRQSSYRNGFDDGLIHTGVQTTQGYYFDSKWMTDFVTAYDDQGRAGPPRDVILEAEQSSIVNGTFVAGLRKTHFDSESFVLDPSFFGLVQATTNMAFKPYQMYDSPLKRIGGALIDPMAEARRTHLGPRQHAWYQSAESIPFKGAEEFAVPLVSVAAIMPLFDATKQSFRGVVTSAMDIAHLYDLLISVKRREEAFANMTALVYNTETQALVASTNHPNVNDLAEIMDVFFDGQTIPPHYKALAVSKSAVVADNALYNYILEHPIPRSGALEGEFDQREYYSHPDLHELNIAVGDDRRPHDASQHAIPLEMREGGCGECVGEDAVHGRVMLFDGRNTLYTDLNLTTDVPYVAAKRRGSGSDPWASDDPLYGYAQPIPKSRKKCIFRNSTLNWNDGPDPSKGAYACSMRGVSAFPFVTRYTVSVRVKPDADVAPGDREQRLFQHSDTGDSLLTVFASGAMMVGSLFGECVVPGVGMQGGVWTTVTARYDRSERICEVFLNGTRVAGKASSYKSLHISSRPFSIGSGFVGAMQSVRLFNFHAGPESLSRPGEFTWEVPSMQWFFKVEQMSFGFGLNWTVSVRLPRDDVMRDVDANNRHLTANLAQQAANTQAKLDRDMAETVLITAMVVLISVLLFLVFNDLLTKPFAEVSSVMCDAAVMRIEQIPKSHSAIRELNAMHGAMRLMLANLKEYKSYMPQHITDCLTSDEEDSEMSVSVSRRSSAVDRSAASRVSRSSHSGNSAAHSPQRQVQVESQVRSLLAVNLNRRRVSIAALNVVGFTADSKLPDRAVLDRHAALLEWLIKAIQPGRGIVDSFSGDRFFVSFNASKNTVSYKPAAGKLGCDFRNYCRDADLTPSAGLATGEAKVGNMGCSSMRHFSFLSALVPFAHALERHARNIKAAVLCDQPLQTECKQVFLARAMGLLGLTKYHTHPTSVYEVMKAVEGGCDEWMYELENAEKQNPYLEWNDLVAAVIAENWEEASKLRHVVQDADETNPTAAVLKTAVERCEYVAPDFSPYF